VKLASLALVVAEHLLEFVPGLAPTGRLIAFFTLHITCVVSLVVTEMPLLVTSETHFSAADYSSSTKVKRNGCLLTTVVVEGRMQTADCPEQENRDSGS
jgi:hypothetical protein